MEKNVKYMLTASLEDGCVKIGKNAITEPEKNQRLIRIDYCGICGTDYQKYLNFPTAKDWGHEIIGSLVDAYENPIQRVAIRSTFPCNKCNTCLEQKQYKCLNWNRVSKNGFSEYIAIDNNCIINIDSIQNKIEYVLIEPLYTAINLVNRVMPDKNDFFAIIGNGTIGLLSAFYLWISGCKNIRIYARNTRGVRCQFADSLGIKTYNYTESIRDNLRKSNKIINTAPYETMTAIINYASPYAVVTFNGINKNSQVPLDMNTWHFKNLIISPSFPHPQTKFTEAIELIYANGEKLSSLITHVFSIEETARAFESMKKKEIDFIKVVIKRESNDQKI